MIPFVSPTHISTHPFAWFPKSCVFSKVLESRSQSLCLIFDRGNPGGSRLLVQIFWLTKVPQAFSSPLPRKDFLHLGPSPGTSGSLGYLNHQLLKSSTHYEYFLSFCKRYVPYLSDIPVVKHHLSFCYYCSYCLLLRASFTRRSPAPNAFILMITPSVFVNNVVMYTKKSGRYGIKSSLA